MTLQSMRIVCVHIDSMVSFSTPSTTAAQLEQLNYYSIESNEVIRYCSATHSSSTANTQPADTNFHSPTQRVRWSVGCIRLDDPYVCLY